MAAQPVRKRKLLYGYMTNAKESPRANFVRVKDLRAGRSFTGLFRVRPRGQGLRRVPRFQSEVAVG